MTGPTGSGKTTTVYALLRELRRLDRSLVTLEDPVEYQVDGITQLQVDVEHDLTFSTGLRHMLRLDPDFLVSARSGTSMRRVARRRRRPRGTHLDQIAQHAPERVLRRQPYGRAHRGLLVDGLEKVRAGETSLRELMGARLLRPAQSRAWEAPLAPRGRIGAISRGSAPRRTRNCGRRSAQAVPASVSAAPML